MATNLTGTKIKDTYNQVLHVDGGLEATEKAVNSGTGVASALKVGTQSASVDNIKLDGNTISSTDTNGDITLAPNGTGVVKTDNLAFDGNTVSTTDTDGNLILAPNGTGSVNIANINATGGSISGVTFTGSFSGLTLVESDTLTGGNLSISGNSIVSDDTDGDIIFNPDGTGEILNNAKFGYNAGLGGTVTQLTSKSTGVTLNNLSGQITTHDAQLNRNTGVSFTLTNSFIAATDVVVANISSGATANAYILTVDAVAAGSCRIHIHNILSGTDLSEALVLNFVVIKGVAS